MKQQDLVMQPQHPLAVTQSAPVPVYPRYRELLRSTTLSKRQQIMASLTRLGVALAQIPDEARLMIYADNLEDLPVETLVAVLERAEGELKYLPAPSELREMAGYHSRQIEAMEADAAWMWVQEYLSKHGPEGKAYFVRLKTIDCTKCGNGGWVKDEVTSRSTRCPCKEAERFDAPTVPPRIHYALRQLANGVTSALRLIQTTDAARQLRLREKFNEALKRAPKGEN